MIVVDTNPAEDCVEQALERRGCSVQRRRLDVGDVLIEGPTRICLERKRWADLASSICDGRFHEQKMRMVEDGVKYAYVVEGELPDWDGSYRSMSHKCLWGAVVKTSVRDGIPVLHTASVEDTSCLLQYIAKDDAACLSELPRRVLPGVQKRKRDNLGGPASVLIAMLSIVPGMSASKAEAVVSAFPSASDLCAATQSDLENVSCGSRKLGPKMAGALKAVFGGTV